jgi:hypothetical protein
LLAKRREAVANPMWYGRAARLPGRVWRKVPLILGDDAREIGGQAMEHLAVSYKVIDQHGVIVTGGFIADRAFVNFR